MEESTSTDAPGAGASVYLLYGANDELLYVGITTVSVARVAQHARDKDWWSRVARAEFEHYPSVPVAARREASLVAERRPRYNRRLLAGRRRPFDAEDGTVSEKPGKPAQRRAPNTTRKQRDDSDEWELAEDVQPRPLGSLVAVRFDADTSRRVRQAANRLGLTLSEFVRRAALAAAEHPQLLGLQGRGPGVYLGLVGGSFNVTWQPGEPTPIRLDDATGNERLVSVE